FPTAFDADIQGAQNPGRWRFVTGEAASLEVAEYLAGESELEFLEIEVTGDPHRVACRVVGRGVEEEHLVAVRARQDIDVPALVRAIGVLPVAGEGIGQDHGRISRRHGQAAGNTRCKYSAFEVSGHAESPLMLTGYCQRDRRAWPPSRSIGSER